MKLITRDTDYALRAISFIAKKREGIVSVPELVNKLKMPQPFLRKLLQRLTKKGILISYKGNSGGFHLVKPAEKILLLDLIEIFQGPLQLNECLFKKLTCPNIKECVLRKRLERIEKRVIEELKSISIKSLLRKEC